MTDRPLISLVMTCYHHESIIGEAIAAALAQDYSPLEIVISDDCSGDASFAAIERAVAGYAGPHRIVLNRNPRNLGIAGNVDVACGMASGELIVIAAGDDRSLPHRVSKTAAAWLASGKRAHLVHAACVLLNAAGEHAEIAHAPTQMRTTPPPSAIVENYLYAIGASMAFSKESLTRFGPIGEHALIEDHVLPFRAALLGEIAYIDEPLVLKRPGGIANLAVAATAYDMLFGLHLKELPWKIGDYRQFEADLAHVEREDTPALLAAIRERGALYEMEYRMARVGHLRRLAMLPGEMTHALRIADRVRLKRALLYAGAPVSLWALDRRMRRARVAATR